VPISAAFLALVISVHDGDSLRVRTDAGASLPIRIAHIDAPELRQEWGRVSGASLRRLCLGKQAQVRPQVVDRYGRTVAEVTCGRTDASHHQVERGLAWVFRKYESDDSPLLPVQSLAQFHRRGLWTQAYPLPPWRWRHQSQ
jgi:endonuclease YncB( thermonuclease family)